MDRWMQHWVWKSWWRSCKTGTYEMGTWTGWRDWADEWDDEVLYFQKAMADTRQWLPIQGMTYHCLFIAGHKWYLFLLGVAISVQSLFRLFKFSVGHCKSMMLLRRNPIKLLCLPCVYLASYPGLLTPVFVTCSTNVGEGLMIMCSDIPGHWVDVWRSGSFTEKLQISECTINHKHRP